MNFIHKIRSVFGAQANDKIPSDVLAPNSAPEFRALESPANIQISLFGAANGTILQVGVFKPNPRGPDWTFTYYCVTDSESLSDAVVSQLVAAQLRAK